MRRFTKYQEWHLKLLVAALRVFGRLLVLSRSVILTVSRQLLSTVGEGSAIRAQAEATFVEFLATIFSSEDTQRVLSRLEKDDVFWDALASSAMNDGQFSLENVACHVCSNNEFSAGVHRRMVQAFVDSKSGSPVAALYGTTHKHLRPAIVEMIKAGAKQVNARGMKVSDDDEKINVALEMLAHSSGRHVEKALDVLLTTRYRDAVLRRAIEINRILDNARSYAPSDQREAIAKLQDLIRFEIPWKSKGPVRPSLTS